jgi:hypothetical protein
LEDWVGKLEGGKVVRLNKTSIFDIRYSIFKLLGYWKIEKLEDRKISLSI